MNVKKFEVSQEIPEGVEVSVVFEPGSRNYRVLEQVERLLVSVPELREETSRVVAR